MRASITLVITLLISLSIFAQQGINYKALIKDDNGNVLANQTIDIRLSILDSDDLSIYSETRRLDTDSNGIVIAVIRSPGTSAATGNFLLVDWANDSYQLQTEIDPELDGTFVNLGISPFSTVPYALSSADNLWRPNSNGEVTYSINERVGIGTANPSERLEISHPDAAGLKLETPTFDAVSAIKLENGEETGFHTFFKIENIDDKLNIAVDSDINTTETGYVEKLTVNYNGNVGINETNPDQKLDINGKLKIGDDSTTPTIGSIRYNAAQNSFEGFINNSGWVTLGKDTTKNIVIPASAFQPSRASNFIITGSRAYFSSGSGASHSLIAPVIIPTGSRITTINYVYYDSDSNDDLLFYLRKSCDNSISITTLQTHFVANTTSSSVRNHQFAISEIVEDDCQYFISASAFRPGTTSSDWSSDLYVIKSYITYEGN